MVHLCGREMVVPVADLRSLESLRVVVADDHPYYRAGLARLLRDRGAHVVEASNGEAAIQAVEESAPDVVLMDLQMPGVSGLDATRFLTDRTPPSRVLMLSVSAEEADVSNAILAGATGYVLKDEPVDQVLTGVRAAASGKALISPRVAQVLLRRVHSSIEAGDEFAGGGLSVQELEALQLLADGNDDCEVVEAVSNILGKLQFERRVKTAARALRSRGH
jgi:DNA-binding NarL/FixJ family response regulator